MDKLTFLDFPSIELYADFDKLRSAEHLEEYPHRITVRLKPEGIPDFILEFCKDKSFEILDFSKFYGYVYGNSSNLLVSVSLTTKSIVLLSKNKSKSFNEFTTKYSKYLTTHITSSETISVACYYNSPSGVDSETVNVSINDMGDCYDFLYPDFNVGKLINSFLYSYDKILVLYGLPGTGKTSLIKEIIKKDEFNKSYRYTPYIAYTKDTNVIQSDSFWLQVQANNKLIIFDDLDASLSERSKDDDKFLSKLLTFTEGILVNNTKVVIATNQKINNIDSALLRPGRCFDFLELRPLTYEEAVKCWSKLSKDMQPFEKAFSSHAEISQASIMRLYRECNRTEESSYMKDGSTLESRLQKLGIGQSSDRGKAGF